MTALSPITRRRFLIASGVSAGLAGAGTAIGFEHIRRAAAVTPRSTGAPALVVITLYGGNDGLGTVIPAGDKAYQAARTDLAYQPDEVLPLADGLGLNPAMKQCKAWWDKKRLAIIRGVSYPDPDHSHFRSMAIWQSASPQSASTTGWLGRWLDEDSRGPLGAIAIGPTLPPMLVGAKVAGATLPVGGLRLPSDITAALPALGAGTDGVPALQGHAARSITDLLAERRQFADLPTDPTRDSPLAAELDLVSRCIAAGAPTGAYSVSLGGFDTHADEKSTQSRLLGELDAALGMFLPTVAGKNVVVAIYSEFGRRVAANANDGTDHGTAGPVLIVGDTVRGGFYGDEPSLTDLDDGDLKVSTDFRDVYATLLEKVLRTDPDPVLGGHRGRIAFV